MGGSTGFNVLCKHCGHINCPGPGAETGIKNVMNGSFNSCRRCKARFNLVILPNRPIVRRLVSSGLSVIPHVKIQDYTGKVPMAMGMC